MLFARSPLEPSSFLTIEQSRDVRRRGAIAELKARPELRWMKTLGSIASQDGLGRGPGDPRRRITICVWESRGAAEAHLDSPASGRLGKDWAAALDVVRTRGDHAGASPLLEGKAAAADSIAVLTLGQASLRSLSRFAAQGSALRAPLRSSPGLVFATSAGWPPSGNCTFSVWSSEDAMLDFAYRDKDGHAKVAGAQPPILSGQLNARMQLLRSRGLGI